MKIIIKNSTWKILKEFIWTTKKTLISQIRDEDIDVHSACHHWICWACMFNIEKGNEFIIKNFKWEPWFPLDEQEVMSCIAWIKDTQWEIILKSNY